MFTDKIDLTAKPYFLSEKDIHWVNDTLNHMSDQEKLGQLFCLCSRNGDVEELYEYLGIITPGAIMVRPMTMDKLVKYKQVLDKQLEIPPLISANLEKGGNGFVEEGTFFASPLEAAATGEYAVQMARRLGVICGREAAALGVNWSFSPIIDIDYNFRNPITNTRTFGNDPERVKKMGVAYVQAVQECGVAATLKHFPGDGRDERDQHLVVSINDLTCEQWDETYGAAYKAGIDAGAMSVMVGHIMLPEYQKRLNPKLQDEELMPGTLSRELTQELLRGKLGFNGLIVTDATTMAGFNMLMPRYMAVPLAIERGTDMFLFTRNMAEDYQFMAEGYRSGILSKQRLRDAVTRILATKAALGLHRDRRVIDVEAARQVVGCAEHLAWAKGCAEKSITLVKAQKGVLPLSPKKYKKVLFFPIEAAKGVVYSVKEGVCSAFRDMLSAEGFDVEEFVPCPNLEGNMRSHSEIMKYDLIIYLANISTKSNQTSVRIEWQQPMGANLPIYGEEIPTIFISVENPYHLLDVPRVKTYINTYSSHDAVLQALLDKLMGRSEFSGVSPVDAFCGKWDTRL